MGTHHRRKLIGRTADATEHDVTLGLLAHADFQVKLPKHASLLY